MQCANCRTDDSPAYTLRAHVDDQAADEADRADDEAGRRTATDGGTEAGATVDLRFCSFECLKSWT